MKITIDTKEDSHEDIQKVLHVLKTIAVNKGTEAHSQTNSSEDTTSMMSMFSDTNENKENSNTGNPQESTNVMSMFSSDNVKQESSGSAPDFTSFLNLAKQSQEKKDNEEPKIQFF